MGLGIVDSIDSNSKANEPNLLSNLIVIDSLINFAEANFQEWVIAIEKVKYTAVHVFDSNYTEIVTGNRHLDPQTIKDLIDAVNKADLALKNLPSSKNFMNASTLFYKQHLEAFIPVHGPDSSSSAVKMPQVDNRSQKIKYGDLAGKVNAETGRFVEQLTAAFSRKDIELFKKSVLQLISSIGESGTLLAMQQIGRECYGSIDLEEIKDNRVAELFALSMCEEKYTISSTALDALSRIGTNRSVPKLFGLLNVEPGDDWGIGGGSFRSSIVYALGKIAVNDDLAELPVRKFLESFSDPDPLVSQQVKESISRMLFERATKLGELGRSSESCKYYRDFLSSAPPHWSGYIETARSRIIETEKIKK